MIFISYRRSDTEGQAGRLYDDLRNRFGPQAVFIDVSGIEKGLDFRRVIDQRASSCRALLVMIGKDWLTVASDDGKRRLDDPDDFVRLETSIALKRDIPVIPVLVHGAVMPREQDLPPDLKPLAYRNGVEITHARWDSDVNDLIGALVPYLNAPYLDATAKPAPLPAPAVRRPSPVILGTSALAALVLALVGFLVFRHKPVPAPENLNYSRVLTTPAGDTLQVMKVNPPPGTPLKSGVQTNLVFLVHYALKSRPAAQLVISLNQSAANAATCSPGQLVDAGRIAIERGERDVELSIVWHGGASKGVPQAKGFVNPYPSLWGPEGQKRLAGFPLREACWQFGPG